MAGGGRTAVHEIKVEGIWGLGLTCNDASNRLGCDRLSLVQCPMPVGIHRSTGLSELLCNLAEEIPIACRASLSISHDFSLQCSFHLATLFSPPVRPICVTISVYEVLSRHLSSSLFYPAGTLLFT
jgi:hypothetical protein